MRSRRTLLLCALVPFAFGACLFPSLASLSDADAMGDATGDAPKDAANDAASCPGTAGPTMVRVDAPPGSYCVDRTEVTNAQYTQFLAAAASFDRNKLPSVCAAHGPFIPLGADGGVTFPYPAGLDDYPVGNVDWCDAFAFCSWAGKRLCGRIGGGSNPMSDAVNPAASQWFQACSLNRTEFYPYGNTYDGSTCNSHDRASTPGPLAVGSLAGCQGGYSGLFDMSGNVEELEDSCDDAGACYSRGGSYFDTPASGETRCDTLSQVVLFGHHSSDIGFRCCGP
jgi:sulfatase modifying factor 1